MNAVTTAKARWTAVADAGGAPTITAAIRARLARQLEERWPPGERSKDGGLAFTSTGFPWRDQDHSTLPRSPRTSWCAQRRFHDLGHAGASLLLLLEVEGASPRVVMDMRFHRTWRLTWAVG